MGNLKYSVNCNINKFNMLCSNPLGNLSFNFREDMKLQWIRNSNISVKDIKVSDGFCKYEIQGLHKMFSLFIRLPKKKTSKNGHKRKVTIKASTKK